MPIPTDLAALPLGVGAKVAGKVGKQIMYALPKAATPAGMVTANKAAEIVSTGYGKGLRVAKNAVGTALRNQKKIEKGADFAIGWFDPTPSLTDWGQYGGASSYIAKKVKEHY